MGLSLPLLVLRGSLPHLDFGLTSVEVVQRGQQKMGTGLVGREGVERIAAVGFLLLGMVEVGEVPFDV